MGHVHCFQFFTHVSNATMNIFGHKAFSSFYISPHQNRFLEKELSNSKKEGEWLRFFTYTAKLFSQKVATSTAFTTTLWEVENHGLWRQRVLG